MPGNSTVTVLPESVITTVTEPGTVDLEQAAILAAAGLALADQAYDEYKEATDDLEDANQRRLAMARVIHSHNMTVTHPYLKYAMNYALGIDVRQPDYGGMCSFYKTTMLNSLSKAKSASADYMASFCIEPSSCRRELDFYAGVASADSAYARTRSQERRRDRLNEERITTILAVHSGTFKSPSPIFGLIDNAAQIYGYIQQQAFGNLSGALATFSYGFKSLFNGIG